MGLYDRYVLPRLIDLFMRHRAVSAERARFVPMASGKVLEVGIGSGLNLRFYSPAVESLCGVDPSLELLAIARRRVVEVPFAVELIPVSAERLPAGDESFDTVVTTWTLCTVPDPLRALAEMRRVLKADGQLIFIEHGRSPDARVLAWQDRLNPLWNRIGGGCNLNRRMDELIRDGGLRIAQLETGYSQGPKLLAYLYRGTARRPEAAEPG